jgi:sulfur-oxidizing protein SoxZ
MQLVIKGAKAGDKVGISWRDSRGETRSQEAVVA